MDRSLKDGFRLGAFRVMPLQNLIDGPDGEVHLQPKVMEVLVVLARYHGQLVERETILEEVWGGRAVSDEPLNRCIAQLRKHLNDSRDNPHYIQTIPKRGYQLVQDVLPSSDNSSDTDRPQADGLENRAGGIGRWLFVAAAVLVIAAIAAFWRSDDAPDPGPPDNSIAVLPFVSMSPDTEHEYFSDGLAEELLTLLAGVSDLKVTSRTSSFTYRDSQLDAPTIAKALNVAYILEGSVRQSGDRIRVTAQLIDAASDIHVWAKSYDRNFSDIFELQDDIAGAVLDSLKLTLTNKPVHAHTTDPELYSLYLQARHLFRQGSIKGYHDATELLLSVVARDPDYAPAWESLSSSYSYLVTAGEIPYQEGSAKARDAAINALKADPGFAQAHAHLGWDAMVYQRDFASAATHFETALGLAPNNSAVIGNAGVLSFIVGDLERAIELTLKTIELDPVDSAKYSNLATYYIATDQHDLAEQALVKSLSISPDDVVSQVNLALLRLLQGRPDDAVSIAEDLDSELFRLLVLPMAYHSIGRSSESGELLGTFSEDYSADLAYFIAAIHAWRGEKDEALSWLEKAVDEGQDVSGIRTDPFMRSLHPDPRWQAILFKLGLSDKQVANIDV